MRSTNLIPALVLSLTAQSVLAGPVKIAVAGVTGDASPQELQRAASELRSALAARVDPTVFAVVTRDEMSRVYEERGAPCRPDDASCLVEASAAWGGRLFIRSRLVTTGDTMSFSVSLDSVRGLHVGRATRSVANGEEALASIPELVDELLAKERAFRASLPMPTAVPSETAEVERAGPSREGARGNDFVCGNLMGTTVAAGGDITLDDDGIRFRSTSGFATEWHHRWVEIKIAYVFDALSSQMYVQDGGIDSLGVTFKTAAERDRCFSEVNRRWHAAGGHS